MTGVSTAMTIGFLAMAVGQHGLGQPVRSVRPTPGGAHGRDRSGGEPGAGQPGDIANRVSDCLRSSGRCAATAAILAPMMACVTGWFDTPARSCRVAGLGRHGHGADDHGAACSVADLEPRLADVDADHRRARRGADDPGRTAGCAGHQRLEGGAAGMTTSEPAIGHDRPAGRCRSPQFIVLMLGEFLLLRHPSGPDLSHGELCSDLRHPMIAAVSIYSVEGVGRQVQSGRVRPSGRSVRRHVSLLGTACCRPSACSLMPSRRARRILRRRGDLRLHLRGNHAALCGDHPGKFPVRR